MTDPTLTQALATPCKRCGGMPIGMVRYGTQDYRFCCRSCSQITDDHSDLDDTARQWVEMNKGGEDAT